MDSVQFSLPLGLALLVLGVFLGAFVYWFATRGNLMRAVDAAHEQARFAKDAEVARAISPLTAEISGLTQRLQAKESELERLQQAHDTLQDEHKEMRDELDKVSDDVTGFRVRADRVPILEGLLAEASQALRDEQEKVLGLTGKLAQADALAPQLAEVTNERDGLRIRRDELTEEVKGLSNDKVQLDTSLKETGEARARSENDLVEARRQLEGAQTELTEKKSEASGLKATLEATRAALTNAQDELKTLRDRTAEQEKLLAEAGKQLSLLDQQLQAEKAKTAEHLASIQAAGETLTNQFKVIADQILETKSQRFTEQNAQNLGALLDPLRTRLNEFQARVDAVHGESTKDRTALAEQVRALMELNQRVGQEANNLVEALKGSSKVQGDYGEMLLERTLEFGGLERDVHYKVQDSKALEDGRHQRPDVIVEMPGNRCIVVDSKLSLTAYERFCSCETEETSKAELKAHLDSVRAHMRGLAAKDYTAAYGLKSLDFVIMFVPLEPAYSLVFRHDRQLIEEAYERKVLLCTHTTLLFVIRTVWNLWVQESQSRNAIDIAKRGAELYDKLAAFVSSLEAVGARLRAAQESYDEAHKRLVSGRGNAIQQATLLKKLGVKASKDLPGEMVEAAQLSHEQAIGVGAIETEQSSKLPVAAFNDRFVLPNAIVHGRHEPGEPES